MLDCDLMPILFGFDSDSLPQAAVDELNEMAQIMLNHPGYTGKIMSFTDSIGTFEYNLDLSRRRCDAAKEILISAGVDASRIETDPEAELAPVAINTEDDSGRHFNRRLELMIYDQNGNPACAREEMDIPEDLKIR
jgi:outer membrane protein OmpA-like peptidoglycan-associated protein